jgi:hypothetical protein
MKPHIFLLGLLLSANLYAEKPAEQTSDEWQNTSISDATIKKIQDARIEYKKCFAEQMQKTIYADMDSRKATDEIIKTCEPILSKAREVYLAEKVPGVIADRHLRQLRIQNTRNVLQSLIFSQAARQQAGKP